MNRGGQAEWCPKCQAWVMPIGTLGKGANAREQKWQCPIHYVATYTREEWKRLPVMDSRLV